MRKGRTLAARLLVVAGLAVPVPEHAQSPVDPALANLVERFVQAQASFDVATLAELTASSYVEISPVGEVDPREKMLGFYAPEHKQPSPSVKVSELEVHPLTYAAIVIAKITYLLPSFDGSSNAVTMRVCYVANQTAGGWKLVSSQYTGIRPPKKQN